MPAYNASATSANKPVLMAGKPVVVWNDEDIDAGGKSQQVSMHRTENLPNVFSVQLEFDGAPGAFEVEVQLADEDAEKYYVKTGTSITAVSASNVARAEFSVVAKFVRLYMKSLANDVNVTAKIF